MKLLGVENLSNIVYDASKSVYVKALPLNDLLDMKSIKDEVNAGNIIILRITPLAKKSIDDVKTAVSELCDFVKSINGDIARLGEERIVITPPLIKIWKKGHVESS